MAGPTTVSVHHSYDAQRDDEIKLEKGEIITVTDSSDPDWWEGKKDDGSIGFFPSNFVEPVKSSSEEKKDADVENDVKGEDNTAEPTETEAEAGTEPAKSIGMARVMEDYAMQGPDELTLHRGGIATLYERLEDGWLKGEINGKVGKFPGECVEEIDMPGRPDLGAQSAGIPKAASESTEEGASSAEPSKPAFKLAAYGVKQGGIGSVLAGGFPSLKKTGGSKKSSESEPKPASPEKVIETTPPAQEEPAAKLESEQALPVEKVDQSQPPAPTPTEKFGIKLNRKIPFVDGYYLVAKAIVLHPYDAENEDELNLLRGEYVNILDKNVDDGWWKGTTERGQTGVFPSNFVKEIEEESIASPPPVRTRKSVTSTSSQQSFNTASSSRASAGISARAPPLPGNRPISTGNTSRPGSLHEQQPSSEAQSPSQPAIPEETTPPPPATTEVTSPVAASSEADKEAEEEKAVTKELEPKMDAEEEKFSVQEAETKVSSEEESKEESTPVSSPPVPSRPPKTASRPTSEASSLAEKSPLPVSRPTSEATSEKTPTPPSRPTSEASSVAVPPPKPASRPLSQVDSEKSVDSPVVDSSPEEKENTKKDEHVESKEEEKKTQSEEEQVETKEEGEKAQPEEKEVELKKEEESTQSEKTETVEKKEEQDNDTKSPEVEADEEEKKTFDMQPTGPKLSAPSRVRPTRARRSPQPAQESHKEEPSQMDLLKKDLEQEPEESTQEIKRDSEEPTAAARSPPAKPMKPIFAKFPTPFGGAAPELKNLKPVQRRMWEPAPAHEPKESEKKEEEEERPRPTGVRNIASRFNVPTTGGGSNEVLETKLKNFTKNEVDKLRKELQEEREKRVQLEQLVASLAEQVEKLQQ
ncbi:hypothetical protein INT45_002302 [Circinella minor]|uniref:SH3 domain-containing protein n=1 Tax=Circinella minor TaxID=1195481 RepID=A0A8H7VQH5_9FUNG|nr:hypothetical protein INT45_002302 [Circinella minor]